MQEKYDVMIVGAGAAGNTSGLMTASVNRVLIAREILKNSPIKL